MPIGWKWRPPIFLFCFVFPSAFDSLKLYFFFSFFLFYSFQSLLFSLLFFQTIFTLSFFFKWSKNWGNGIKSYPPFSQMFHPLSNGLSIQQHNQQGLKPSTKRSSSMHLDELATWDSEEYTYIEWMDFWPFRGFFLFSFGLCWLVDAPIHSNRFIGSSHPQQQKEKRNWMTAGIWQLDFNPWRWRKFDSSRCRAIRFKRW